MYLRCDANAAVESLVRDGEFHIGNPKRRGQQKWLQVVEKELKRRGIDMAVDTAPDKDGVKLFVRTTPSAKFYG